MKSVLVIIAALSLFTTVNSFGQTVIEYQTVPKNGDVVDRFEGAYFEIASIKTDFDFTRITGTVGAVTFDFQKTTGVWWKYVNLQDVASGPQQITYKIYYTQNDFVSITVDFILEGDTYIDFTSPNQYATFATTLPVDVAVSWDTNIDEVTASVGANSITLTPSATPNHYVGNINISALAIDTFDVVAEFTDVNAVKHSYATQFIHDTKPRVKNINESLETMLTFTTKMFTDSYTGPADLVKVKIISLPAHGALTLSGSPVSANQEILKANLPTLKYEADDSFDGLETFTWNASDGTSYADNSASIKLTVAGHPELTNIYFEGSNLMETHFSLQAFEDAYSYPNPFAKIRIVKLPKYSAIHGVDHTGDYTVDQLAGTDMYYRPFNQLEGKDTLVWNVVTEQGTTASEDAYIVFTYDVAFPTIDPVSFEALVDEEITFTQDDFIDAFHSKYALEYVQIYGPPLHGTFVTNDGQSGQDIIFINEETEVTYQPEEGFVGDVTVEWSVHDGSDVDSQENATLTFSIGNIAGIEDDALNSSVKVSPIPAKNYIDIELKNNPVGDVSITDITGRRITPVLQNNRIYFSENNITRGMYILAVKSNSRVAYRKFIVE